MANWNEALERLLPASVWLKYAVVLGVLIFAFILLRYVSRGLQAVTHRILERKRYIGKNWLSLMDKNKVAGNLFFAVGTAFIASAGGSFLTELFPRSGFVVIKALNSIVIISFVVCLGSALSVVSDRYYDSVKFPVQGLVQAVKVLLWSIAFILVLSVLLEKEPLYFIGGLTALSAVIMLVFKDPLVGLASGMQLSLNDSVRVGDWIEMPARQANGIVTDILLTTVRVRNWDNTIVNIPAYDLVSSSFKNWRGVTEAGARRLQRSFFIDLDSVKILTEEDAEHYRSVPLLKDLLLPQVSPAPGGEYAGGYLTNLGVFRLYADAYLKTLPDIAPKTSVMVHELNPSVQGQPFEIIAYSSLTAGADFEKFQSEVVEHFISIAPKFGLKMYQSLGDGSSLDGVKQ